MKHTNYSNRALIAALIVFTTTSIYSNNQPSFETHFNRGVECFKQQQPDQAITHLKNALALQADHAPTYFNIGLIYLDQKNYSQACNYFEQAIAHNPHYTKAYTFLAQSYQQDNNLDAALKNYRKVVELNPKSVDALLAMASIWREKNNLDQALYCYRHALELDPTNIATLFDMGYLNSTSGNHEEAITYYKKILTLNPDIPNVTYNLAYSLRHSGNMAEALTYYKKTLSHWPEYAHAHYGFAECSLLLGDYQSGWPSFEYRWKRDKDARNFSKKLWDGSNLSGKTILLRAEYGQGDTIQFIRYAPLLKAQGATVILEAQNTLVTLLSLCPYLDKVIHVHDDPEQLPAHDCQVPLMSLPYYFHTTLATIPTHIPYLTAHPELVNIWKEKLSHDKRFKIGICWEGSPYYEQFKTARSKKSLPVADFLPLAQLPNVSLYSLQKMNGTEQLHALPRGMTVHDFGDDFDCTHGRFMDTAAVIMNLDLIITVDTSVAHLAGALGKPVWVLLPVSADWRWLQDRDDSPWYPNMRLFRQPDVSDWPSVIEIVRQELVGAMEQEQARQSAKKQMPTTLSIMAEIQIGELIDKITILQIKAEKIKDPAKLKNINTELETLLATCQQGIPQSQKLNDLWCNLLSVNKDLWKIEDDIRDKERAQEFDEEFVRLARAVYYTNDERCRIKRLINELSGSRLMEEKSYRDYKQK